MSSRRPRCHRHGDRRCDDAAVGDCPRPHRGRKAARPGAEVTKQPLGAAVRVHRCRRRRRRCRRKPPPRARHATAQPRCRSRPRGAPEGDCGRSVHGRTLGATGGGSLTWAVSAGSAPVRPHARRERRGPRDTCCRRQLQLHRTGRVPETAARQQNNSDLLVAERLTANAPADQPWEVGRPLQISINARRGTPGYSWKLGGARFPSRRNASAATRTTARPASSKARPGRGRPAFPDRAHRDRRGRRELQVTVTPTAAPKPRLRTFAVGRGPSGQALPRWRSPRAAESAGKPRGLLRRARFRVRHEAQRHDPVSCLGKARRRGRFRFTVLATDSSWREGGSGVRPHGSRASRPDTSRRHDPRCRNL